MRPCMLVPRNLVAWLAAQWSGHELNLTYHSNGGVVVSTEMIALIDIYTVDHLRCDLHERITWCPSPVAKPNSFHLVCKSLTTR